MREIIKRKNARIIRLNILTIAKTIKYKSISTLDEREKVED